jgi:hypothetical protein
MVALWRKWQEMHQHTEKLFHQQQRLEQKLIETVGFQGVAAGPRDGECVMSHSVMPNDGRVHSDMEEVESRARNDFLARQARWEAVDREIGYSAALRAERQAGQRTEALLRAMSDCPAASLAGVAGKLDAVLREGNTSDDAGEFPWPQIRSVFEDIVRIGRRMDADDVFLDGLFQPR